MNKSSILFSLTIILLLIGCKKNKIPEDVVLSPISQDASGVQIEWSESTNEGFESYKLYRHSSSGIDETTGNLIHVSTSPTDHSFTDEDFDPLEEYFYRVYVLNSYGLSTGSNIEAITTETISLIQNGSFETGATLPTDWTVIQNNISQPLNKIEIDASKASDGSQSLKFHHHEEGGCWEMWIEQYVKLSDLTAGATYEFSLDYSSNTDFALSSGMGIKLSNTKIDIQIPHQAFPGDGAWHTHSAQFTLPADIGSADPLLRVHFCVDGITDWWIDNFSIVKV